MEVADGVAGIQLDANMIERPVRRMLNDPGVSVREWTATPITGSMAPGTIGVVRITGTASAADVGGETDSPFSVILKMMASGGEPGHRTYWKREAVVYSSGLLDYLPAGLRAPECYGVGEESESIIRLWLEDLGEGAGGHRWSIADYQHAARLIGRLNGSPIPALFDPPPAWWLRDVARQWIEAMNPIIPRLEDARSDAVIGQLWSDRSVNALLEIGRQAPRLLELLDRFPVALSHGDAHQKNFVLPDAGCRDDAILFDWSDVGLRPAGADLHPLFHLLIGLGGYDVEDLVDLSPLIFDSYLEGLSDADWSGDPRDIRQAFAASFAVRWGYFPVEVFLSTPEQRARAEASIGLELPDLLRGIERNRLWALELIQDLPHENTA